jgi:signal peptidase
LAEHEALREVLSGILIVAILYFGVQGALFLILRTDSPMMAVVSNSMKPTFERGDLLMVMGVESPSDIAENDIIVYRLEGQTNSIVHRVIEVVNQNDQVLFKTKGDANSSPDPRLVKPHEVRGKVLFWIPKLGYISIWFRGG